MHSLSAEQISTYSKGQFENLVSKRTKTAAFAYLIDQKQKFKKCNSIQYNDTFKMAKYLKSGSRISKTLSQQIFSIQSENLEVVEEAEWRETRMVNSRVHNWPACWDQVGTG